MAGLMDANTKATKDDEIKQLKQQLSQKTNEIL
jgi:chromosome segregation ATPase